MAKCSSCGADIIWARTLKGKAMPLDAKPKQVAIFDVNHEAGHPDAQVSIYAGYTSHFATCPNADQHRRKR